VIEIASLILVAIISFIIVSILESNLLITTLIFFALPTIYLSFKNQASIKPALIFALLASLTFGLLIDYLGYINQVWYTPETIFGVRLFGGIPIENPLLPFLWIYLILISYAHCTKDKLQAFSIRKLIIIISLVFATFIAVFLINQSLLGQIHYFYLLVVGMFIIPPITIITIQSPGYLPKCLPAVLYIGIVSILDEIAAVKLNHWNFPSTDFIGWVDILDARFPIEELLSFVLIGPFAVLSYYELLKMNSATINSTRKKSTTFSDFFGKWTKIDEKEFNLKVKKFEHTENEHFSKIPQVRIWDNK